MNFILVNRITDCSITRLTPYVSSTFKKLNKTSNDINLIILNLVFNYQITESITQWYPFEEQNLAPPHVL